MGATRCGFASRGLTLLHDCGANVRNRCSTLRHSRKYDIVFASNVLNVQPTCPHIRVLDQTYSLISQAGLFCNFPSTLGNITIVRQGLTDMLNERYIEVICLQGRTWMWSVKDENTS